MVALHPAGRPRHAEAVGEDQPARAQVVDQDLAGDALVGRGRVLDADAGHLGVEQLLDRQLAAPVGQADDDAIDLMLRDQAGMSAGVPTIAGLTIRSPIREASSSMKPMTR